jgi:Flp pilus assembly protein TadG
MGGRTRSGFHSWKIRQSAILKNRFQRGQATLEILIVLLILIPLIFGGIELSRGVAVRAALDSGVGVAVQALSIDPSQSQYAWAANVVATTVAQNVFGSAGLGPVNFEAHNSVDTIIDRDEFAALNYGEPFCIVGWVDYSPLIPLLTLAPGSVRIRVRHCGIIERIG